MRRHFRMKLRNLFIKFIRKFGSVHLSGVELGCGILSLSGVTRKAYQFLNSSCPWGGMPGKCLWTTLLCPTQV